jgi:DNA polymerase-3 subunit delta
MIALYHGDNNYDSWNDLLTELRAAKKEYAVLNGDEIDKLGDIFAGTDNYSFFGGTTNTAVIVKRISRNKQSSIFKALEEKLKTGLSRELYLWEDEKLEKESKVLKLATKYGIVKLYKAFDKLRMRKFVVDLLKKDGIEISETTLGKLLIIAPTNKYSLESEISKLIMLTKAKGENTISEEYLNVVTHDEIESQVWDLTEAISKRNQKLALELTNKLVKRNEDFPMVIAALAGQLELLYLLQLNLADTDLTSKFKIHPFVLSKNKYFAHNFTLPQLQMLFMKITNLDFNIKQGKIDSRLGLNLLITTI